MTAATATQLTVSVPAGATTGTIGVTTPTGSATSAASFTVATSSGLPTITGFAPATAAAGTAFTVNGTNFDSLPINNNLRLNISPVQVTSASSTTLQTTVPASATTGRVTVATANGMATTANYVWIAPPPYAATDLDSTATLPFATATTVSVPTANLVALRAFEGVEGHRVSIKVTGVTASTSVYLYDPFGNVVRSAANLFSDGLVDVTALQSTATYSVVVDPQTTGATSATVTLYDVPPDFTSTISAGGPSVVVPITTPGQNGSLTFAGTAGQRVSLQGTNGSIFGQIVGCDVFVTILNPDRSVLGTGACMEGDGFIDATTLPTTGTYTIVVDPASFATGNLTLTLYAVSDFTSSISAGGPAVTVPITAPGQNGALTFTGTALQSISLQGTNGTIFGQIAGCDVNVSIIRNTDQSTVAAATCMEGSGFIDATTLPATDTYTIVVDPTSTATGNLTLTLYAVSDVTGPITANGSPVVASIATPGQNARLTFSGTALQRVSLQGSGTISGQIIGCDVNVSIVRSTGNATIASACMDGSGFIDVTSLPATDTYTVLVDPVSTATGNLTLSLYTVPADASGSLTINGSSLPVSLATPGQNANLTFTVASTQQVTVHLTSNTISGASPCVTVSLMSGASTLTSSSSCGASFDLTPQSLAAGTYTVKIDPVANSTGSITARVSSP